MGKRIATAAHSVVLSIVTGGGMLAREWLEKGIDEYHDEDYVKAWSSFQLAIKEGFPDIYDVMESHIV